MVDASRGLNPFCTKRGVVLEDLEHVQHTVRQGDFMMVNDLDSGYWHVPSLLLRSIGLILGSILSMKMVQIHFGSGKCCAWV